MIPWEEQVLKHGLLPAKKSQHRLECDLNRLAPWNKPGILYTIGVTVRMNRTCGTFELLCRISWVITVLSSPAAPSPTPLDSWCCRNQIGHFASSFWPIIQKHSCEKSRSFCAILRLHGFLTCVRSCCCTTWKGFSCSCFYVRFTQPKKTSAA